MTLQNVVISFHLNKQKSFNYGQLYVVLSRSTSLQGLQFLGQINNKHLKANPRVHNEYDRLRRLNAEDIQENTNTDKERAQDTNSALTLSLLNIRSPRKHSSDVKCDENLFKSDILSFTETQLLPGDNDFDIVQNLTPFTLYRYDHNSDKFCSQATCVKNNFHILNQEYFTTLNAVKFVVTCDTNDVQEPTKYVFSLSLS